MPKRVANVWIIIRERQCGRYLLLRRAKHKPNGGQWNFPGGGVDKSESPRKAAKRELLEEAGIRAKGLKKQARTRLRRKTYYYRMEVPQAFFPIINQESDAAAWVYPKLFPGPLHRPTYHYFAIVHRSKP